MFCDWFKNATHFLSQSEAKPEPTVTCSHAFSRAWRRFHVFASSSDWFIVLFTSVVIGQSACFGCGCRTLNLPDVYFLFRQSVTVSQSSPVPHSLSLSILKQWCIWTARPQATQGRPSCGNLMVTDSRALEVPMVCWPFKKSRSLETTHV